MRVLYVIAQENFRDEEYLVPKDILEDAGAEVVTASPMGGVSTGMLGAEVEADLRIGDANPADYDAVVVAGGGGSREYLWDDTDLRNILKGSYDDGKVVAGICLSGAVLAKAGVLDGRKATVFETPETVQALDAGGAEYVKEDVVTDGKVITASGPQAAEEYGRRIVEAIRR
ncbi:MAG: hypothetical protein GF416_07910 [Candidatus Altiarchaeales archaeon]|nr:hypothetical protein [Candidatus Altiarchaeales archaeon]MBD3417038.1 hypothetical protein [Candidatus Altiarchaeales archaeon]